MRIRVLSDLHLEIAPLALAPAGEDVVVLAGDIHAGTRALAWAREQFPHTPIVYVAGNHEYYGTDWNLLPGQIAAQAQALDIRFLDCSSTILGDVRFLGCTLWTDFAVFGIARQTEAMAACKRTLHDYRYIQEGARLIEPEDTQVRHARERAWLQAQLEEDPAGRWRATVVVTHMLPSFRSTAPRFQDQLTTAGFASDLDALVDKTALWIHGHTHSSFDYALGAGRVVCNPRGYVSSSRRIENGGFDEKLLITV